MRKLLLAVVVTLGFTTVAHAVCDTRTTTCLTAVETSGDAVIGGNASIAGNTTITGSLAITGATTVSAPGAPYSRTIAQLNALAPAAAGRLVFCSNCTRSALCISTGTAAGAWSVAISTDTSPAYTSIHCQ